MATIPIRDVPGDPVQPSGDELILIDNGIAMQKATINDAVTPKATEIADDKIADLNLGTASQADVEDFATAAQGELADTAVQPARTITAGDGLTGGGDLSADRTISLNSASIASLAKADTAVQSVVGGANVTVDATDPQNPIISVSGGAASTDFATVADLLADDNDKIGYAGSGADTEVLPGDIIEAQGFRYEVAESDAEDAHVETAGGVKLKAIGQELWAEQLGARPNDPSIDNAPILNRLLAMQGANVRVGKGSFRCLSSLIYGADGASASSFHGSGRSEDGTVFDFSEAPNDTDCLQTLGSHTRRRWGNFRIVGRRGSGGTTALAINGNGSNSEATTRDLIENITVAKHAVGWRSEYAWTMLVSNLEMRECDLCQDLVGQTNNIQFDTAIFLNSKEFIRATNVEGGLYNNPLFQNIEADSSKKYAVTMRQSSITMINPYIENIDQGSGTEFALVGTNRNPAGEFSQDVVPSDLIIIGGAATNGATIRHRRLSLASAKTHTINVMGIRSPTNPVVILPDHNDELTTAGEGGALTLNSSLRYAGGDGYMPPNECIQSIGKDASGFANPTTGPTPNGFYSTISRTGDGVFRHVVEGLTIGDFYTIVILARAQSAITNRGHIRWRNGGVAGPSVRLDRNAYLLSAGDPLNVRYVHVQAAGDTLVLDELPKDVDIDFYLFRLYRGAVFPEVDPFQA